MVAVIDCLYAAERDDELTAVGGGGSNNRDFVLAMLVE